MNTPIADKFDEYLRDVRHPKSMLTPEFKLALKTAFMAGSLIGAIAADKAWSPMPVIQEVKAFMDDLDWSEINRN